MILVGVINTTQAVQPVPKEMVLSLKLAASDFFLIIFSSSSPYLLSISSSTLRKVSISASWYFSSLYNLDTLSWVTKMRSTYLETSRPRWWGKYRRDHRRFRRLSCHCRCRVRILLRLTWSVASLRYRGTTLHLASGEFELQLSVLCLVARLLEVRLSQIRSHIVLII